MSVTQIGFCADTAHLPAGGDDPAELIRRYPDRIRHRHFTDLQLDPLPFLTLGQGVINFPEVLAAVRESADDGWLIVELDACPGDPLEAARITKPYLDQFLSTKVA
ncbi:MAG: sugar phosphate isomerase/epimerase [Propionibacteriaceae bacterium]|jgi:inosose dehydratase|nr:sugar phosphate isomerase/epimerase [Propionibacteriaceae bacterium]